MSLSAICGALDIPAGGLVTANHAPSSVVRATEQPTIRVPDSPVTYRWLSGAFRDRQIEVLVGEFPCDYGHPQAAHGGEEFGHVLEGELTLLVEGEECELGPGDSYHIPPSVAHGYRTPPDRGAKVLWALTQQFIEWHNQTRSVSSEVWRRPGRDGGLTDSQHRLREKRRWEEGKSTSKSQRGANSS